MVQRQKMSFTPASADQFVSENTIEGAQAYLDEDSKGGIHQQFVTFDDRARLMGAISRARAQQQKSRDEYNEKMLNLMLDQARAAETSAKAAAQSADAAVRATTIAENSLGVTRAELEVTIAALNTSKDGLNISSRALDASVRSARAANRSVRVGVVTAKLSRRQVLWGAIAACGAVAAAIAAVVVPLLTSPTTPASETKPSRTDAAASSASGSSATSNEQTHAVKMESDSGEHPSRSNDGVAIAPKLPGAPQPDKPK
ncbi:hypothetical protein SB816_21110 [Achromobacter sp. SIMBA_011]|uniref:hypothetical protein n=1 Tax=Achromobacter sp. SIMBA_011 TaxID=3085759 RepID=UPI00397DE31B